MRDVSFTGMNYAWLRSPKSTVADRQNFVQSALEGISSAMGKNYVIRNDSFSAQKGSTTVEAFDIIRKPLFEIPTKWGNISLTLGPKLRLRAFVLHDTRQSRSYTEIFSVTRDKNNVHVNRVLEETPADYMPESIRNDKEFKMKTRHFIKTVKTGAQMKEALASVENAVESRIQQ